MAPSTAMQFLILLCFVSSGLVARINGQPRNRRFISIDCGLPENTTYDADQSNGNMRYVSDAGFTDSGDNSGISPPYVDVNLAKRYLNVRYFPAGARNCYTLPASGGGGGRYLVRAAFYYGDYDGLSKPPVFDLHLGVNHWTTVNITDAGTPYVLEVVAVAPADFLQVCLVNRGLGTPFISGLDLRPLRSDMYDPWVNATQSLALLSFFRPTLTFGFNRYHFRPADNTMYRYPSDHYDRIWQRFGNDSAWTNITISDTVQNSNISSFDVQPVILQSACTPAKGTRIDFSWSSDPSMTINNSNNITYLLLLYFAELQRLPSNALRQFDILVDNATWNGSQNYTPKYLFADAVTRTVQGSGQHSVSLVTTPNTTLPPILNAFEIYSMQPMTELATNAEDARAMMSIRANFGLKKNWMGDPCAPKSFAWDSLNCSYSASGPAWITALNLSSSGLTSTIDASFGDLKSLQYLDLSNNSLYGPIPDFLAQMASLTFLDLSSNNLSGSTPASLLQKHKNGFLILRIDNNANLCDNDASTCEPNTEGSSKTLVTTIVVPIVISTLLFMAAIFVLCRMRNKQATWVANTLRFNSRRDWPSVTENRQFTYNELKLITSNFKEEIGQGGFGAVFIGYLENGTPVAVKMRSGKSSQGDKEFLAEAQHLARVHHRNLVSLVGYCKDKSHLALVYEYMHGGSLEDRLRGEASVVTPLSWHRRLKIALDSAHGLEYLHKSCQPPLIHRDVKTNNILLSADLVAKISDFGLTKVFSDEFTTHVTTQPVGTLGYMDPEYYNTSRLSEKSDVYSFGVVLLELITGQPPAVSTGDTESIHIAQWVRQRLSEGNIESIVDPRMEGEYDVNSLWKVAELALQCKEQPSRERPTMTDVVVELKESLELEASHVRSYYSSITSSTNNLSTTSDKLHTHAQASDLGKSSVLELEQAENASTTHVGPAPR